MVIAVRLEVQTNAFGKIVAGMEEKAERIVAKTARDLEAHAKVRAPVDTGRLRSSIKARRVGPAHWRVEVGADYGVYVEYGTRYMAAQPYLNPALDAVRQPFLDAMKKVTLP